MNHRRHLTAGILTGAAVAAAASAAGAVDGLPQAAAVAALGAGFALFPDLDVASVAQRWFARGVVMAIVVLLLAGAWRVAALTGALALLPMVHHHRGWTHHWLAAPLVPLGALLLWAGIGAGDWPPALQAALPAVPRLPSALWALLSEHGPAYAAMVSGYAAHLLLDGLASARR